MTRGSKRAVRFLLLVAVFAASASAWPAGQIQQAGGRADGPGPAGQGPRISSFGTGFIAGQVVDVPGGKPIPDVSVQLTGRFVVQGAITTYTPITTDSEGRFYFANLPAALYSFSVTKRGYVLPRAGFSISIELTDGDRVLGVKPKLAKVASVSGTLREESGDPVVGTDVFVYRRTIVNGRQLLTSLNISRSDDRGQYRFGNLAYGDYVVCACSRDTIPFDGTLLTTLGSEPLQLMSVAARALTVGSDVVSLDNTLRTYAPVLYSNASTFARATRITIAPGEDKTGVDMNLPLVRSARVSGAVIGASSPVLAASMRLVPAPDGDASADLFSIPPMLVQADGRFDFAMVPPGQYRLMIVHRDTATRGGGPSGAAMSFVGPRGAAPPSSRADAMASVGLARPPDSTLLWAHEPITVGENGVTGLAISLNRSPSVAGRVQLIGAAPPPPAQMLNRATVTLGSYSGVDPLMASVGGFFAGSFAPDASFIISGAVPGKYRLSSTDLPGYPTLKSVVVGGLDITDLPLEVGEKDIADVVITYVDTTMATLAVATNPVPGSTFYEDTWVLAFPVDRKYWMEPAAASRRIRATPVSSHGIALHTGMPAGDYFVAVVTGMDAVDWMEAAKFDALSRRAQRVTVPDTGTARIEVRR